MIHVRTYACTQYTSMQRWGHPSYCLPSTENMHNWLDRLVHGRLYKLIHTLNTTYFSSPTIHADAKCYLTSTSKVCVPVQTSVYVYFVCACGPFVTAMRVCITPWTHAYLLECCNCHWQFLQQLQHLHQHACVVLSLVFSKPGIQRWPALWIHKPARAAAEHSYYHSMCVCACVCVCVCLTGISMRIPTNRMNTNIHVKQANAPTYWELHLHT